MSNKMASRHMLHKMDTYKRKNMSFNALLGWVSDRMGVTFGDAFYTCCGCQSELVQRAVDEHVQTFLPRDDSCRERSLM